MSTEKLRGNEIPQTLFVGVGGIGSDIITRVRKLAKMDDCSKARFVIFDTDANDLERAKNEFGIIGIQTSSPRPVNSYVNSDDYARGEWFPDNNIINGKSVSEGAGQVRAISRLALNATIRQGRINDLYGAIDELFLKDGSKVSETKQAMRVIIASTVAGGTGSGIAMIVAMLIRNYLKKNYPETTAIIRGFLVLPSVMIATIKPSESEKLSLSRNGYATVKEINAFMMRDFFNTVPELNRYKELSVTVPTPDGETEELSCLPFDFCFLFDKTDSGNQNQNNLSQYKQSIAQCIYNQCISSMKQRACSTEDNIVKEFLNEKKFGRNRFGSAGSSKLVYPYESVREYIALDWIEQEIIGFNSESTTEEERMSAIRRSWRCFDSEFETETKERKKNMQDSEGELLLNDCYIRYMSEDWAMAKRLNAMYIEPKIKKVGEIQNDESDSSQNSAVEVAPDEKDFAPAAHYVQELITAAFDGYIDSIHMGEEKERFFMNCDALIQGKRLYKKAYQCISRFEGALIEEKISKYVKGFIRSAFRSDVKTSVKDKDPYRIESYLSLNDKPMHPNAMRYMLYQLLNYCKKYSETEGFDSYFENLQACKYGELVNGKRDTKMFDVKWWKSWSFEKETSLSVMCEKLSGHQDSRCEEHLKRYKNGLRNAFNEIFLYYVCNAVCSEVDALNTEFELFYGSFESKVAGLAKRKKAIKKDINPSKGDSVTYLFSNPDLFDTLVKRCSTPNAGISYQSELYGNIFDAIKKNRNITEQLKIDEFYKGKKVDIFDDVIIDGYEDYVFDSYGDVLDVDIVRALYLEHEMIGRMKTKEALNEEDKRIVAAEYDNPDSVKEYVRKAIKSGYQLACPSIIRNDFEEPREVRLVGYNKFIAEGDGVVLPAEMIPENASDSISKYELHFYRAVYNVTPLQISTFAGPDVTQDDDEPILKSEDKGMAFEAYQDYMVKIGPDNRVNPVITPHIDKRWNSISVLPELDPRGYQRVLMKHIHQAMVYGFMYGVIDKNCPSVKYDSKRYVYRYCDGADGYKDFVVSNHTKCDHLFEVLDALYFDRYAVNSIHQQVARIREKEIEDSILLEKTSFFVRLNNGGLDRCQFIDDRECLEKAQETLSDHKTSIFELPILYWNSIPKKDTAEIEIMIEAIMDVIAEEFTKFANKDDAKPLIADTIVKQYDLLRENYLIDATPFVGKDMAKMVKDEKDKNEALAMCKVFEIIRKKVARRVDTLDVSDDIRNRIQ